MTGTPPTPSQQMVARVDILARRRNRILIALVSVATLAVMAALTGFIILRVDRVLGEVRRNTAATDAIAKGTQVQLARAQVQLSEAQAQISAAQDQLAVLQRSLDAAVAGQASNGDRITMLQQQLSAAQGREARLAALVASEYQQLLQRSMVTPPAQTPPTTVRPNTPTTVPTTVPRPPPTTSPCQPLLHDLGLC